MVTYQLHLVRHGMTQGNADGRYVGRLDLPLCPQGVQTLERLQAESFYPEVENVYTSPLLRCMQTADLLFPSAPLTVVDDLTEMSLGDFEGKNFDMLRTSPAFLEWLENSADNTPPGALEGSREFADRVAVALNSILMNMSREHITRAAVVTHGGVIMSLMSRFVMPSRPMGEWAVEFGQGYTIRTSTQMWMRDETFEVIGRVPKKAEQ